MRSPNFMKIYSVLTCPCGRVVNALGRHVQWRVTRSEAGVRLHPGASAYKQLFLIIPTHMMNREIIPGRKTRVRRCPP